jgi:DNA-binding NarL/FixJ family response regulator
MAEQDVDFHRQPIAVGILEDDEDLTAYLTAIIAGSDDLQLSFAAATLKEAGIRIDEAAIDVCLVDIQLPDGNGLDFARKLKATTGAKVLVLSVLGDRKSVLDAIHVGADGYLMKDTPAEQVCRDIRNVFEGAAPISPQAAAHLLKSYRRSESKGRPASGNGDERLAEPLTEREREVLQQFAEGRTYRQAADALGVSPNTIGAHVKSIYAKLDVNTRGKALLEAGQLGLLDDPDAS